MDIVNEKRGSNKPKIVNFSVKFFAMCLRKTGGKDNADSNGLFPLYSPCFFSMIIKLNYTMSIA